MTIDTDNLPPIHYDNEAITHAPNRVLRMLYAYYALSLDELMADAITLLAASAALSEQRARGGDLRGLLAKYDEMNMTQLGELFEASKGGDPDGSRPLTDAGDQAAEDARKSD